MKLISKYLGKKPIRRVGFVAVALVASGLAVNAFAGADEARPGTAVFAPDVGDAHQIVLVRSSSWLDTRVTIEAFDYTATGWQRALGPVQGVIGRNGFSQAHKEGDGTSPVGVFGLTRAYGLQPAPSDLKIPHQKFGASDWWVSDPESPLYNTLQTGPSNGRWRESYGERLADQGYRTAYRHLVAIDYNVEPVVPYVGSAIFMHVGGNSPTSGCVALDERELLRIMKWLDPTKRPKMVMGPDPWLLNPVPPPAVTGTSANGLKVVEPTRVLDTRNGTGAAVGKVGPGQFIDLSVRGGRVPDDASVVALNLTITQPSAATFLTVTPTNGDNPGVSNLNAHAGDERAALVLARIGADGKVRIRNDSGQTHLVADLVAYGSRSVNDGVVLTNPTRLIDTRTRTDGDLSAMFGPGEERTYETSAPAGAVAAIVNLTAVDATQRTFISAFAGGVPFPGTSTLNTPPIEATPNLAIVPLSGDKQFTLRNAVGNVHLIVDVFGWVKTNEGAKFVPAVTPTRILDTRSGVGRRGQLRADETLTFGVLGMPQSAKAVVTTLTGVNASATTNLRAGASDLPVPQTSNLNLPPTQARANLVLAPVGADGRTLVYNNFGATDVIVDVTGWFE